ncbi:MAG: hypothetical protein M3Y87_36240 [Myxococcota bacterium]|nr:hypothetical protein [Myxococcota bacterium]
MGEIASSKATPLGRWLEWFEGLDAPLRAHLASHVLRPELLVPSEETPSTGAGRLTLSLRLQRAAREPVKDAEIAGTLAERTDRALADARVRASWTGEDDLRRSELDVAPSDQGVEDHLRRRREEATQRSLEWVRASDEWARLRTTGLADRRIERWREKHADRDRA